METKRKLYRELASLIQAIRNCEKSGNVEWRDNHGARLERLVKNHMPSGSGIDNGTTLELDECKPERLVFSFGYHHMNDVGMYDGWTEHKAIVTPSFQGIDIRITGQNRNDIKDYLFETYHYALTQDVEIS